MQTIFHDFALILFLCREDYSEVLNEFVADSRRPSDCVEIYNSGEHSDGVYTVYVDDTRRPVQVYCDMTTDGGGWMVCDLL